MSNKFQYTNLLRNKLSQQKEVYEDFKNNRCPSVCYKGYKDKTYGTQDANYKNRLRLSYYLLYEKVDDEDVIAALFEEELKDRETNSFQGIGDTLQILTQLLWKYNLDGKYTPLFRRAKNANFDCFCGYYFEENTQDELYCEIQKTFFTDNIENNDILDCICLAQNMDYKDIMAELVDLWKETVTDWNDRSRKDLIRFNSLLGREKENEEIYKQRLSSVDKENVFEVASAYNGIVGYYIEVRDYKTAYKYLTALLGGYNLDDIKNMRLYDYFLEYGMEITANESELGAELWKMIKPELQSKNQTDWFGNLYEESIAAAKAVGDPYSEQLEREYAAWKKEVGIK